MITQKPITRTLCLSAIAALALASSGIGAPSLSLSQTSYTLLPGQTFSLSITLVNPDVVTIVAYDFFLRASQDDAFAITAQTLHGVLDQPNSLVPLPYPVSASSSEVNDFGAFEETSNTGVGTGSFLAQTLTLQVLPTLAEGTYQISLGWNQPSLAGGPSLLDTNVNEYQMNSPLVATITVVPESGFTGLGFGAIAALFAGLHLVRRRRARRA